MILAIDAGGTYLRAELYNDDVVKKVLKNKLKRLSF